MPRTCCRCRYWERTHIHSEVGRCRRYPPQPADVEAIPGSPPRLVILHDWPTTLAGDHCGEFTSCALPFTYPSPASAN